MMNNNNPISQVQLEPLMAASKGTKDVCVAIIDGAVDGAHPALKHDQLSHFANTVVGPCSEPNSPSCRHGTFVTGMLAASRDAKVPGICPECRFLSQPIFCQAAQLSQCPQVTQADLAKAVNAAVDAGADIINMSVGLNDCNQSISAELSSSYDKAKAQGVLLVGASGNQGRDEVNSLFEHPWVIPVAAMSPDGSVVPQSNVGDWVVEHGLLAPGKDIEGLATDGGYQSMSGSSVAAPFVTGTLALLKSLYPQATAEQLRQAIMAGGPDEHVALAPQTISKAQPKALNGQASRARLLDMLKCQDSILSQETAKMNQPIPANQATSETAPQTATEAPPDCDCTATQAEANQPRIQSTIAPQFDSNTLQSTGIAPQGMGIHGDFIANAPTEFIYVAGQLRPHFPNQGLKQEYDYAAQLLGKSPYDYYDIFSDPDYRYIAEQVSWILSIDSQDVYVLLPDSSDELNEFIATLKMEENLTDETQTVAIGILGPVAPADLTPKDQPLKMVLCKHLYHFTYAELLKELTGNNTTTTSIRDVLEALSKKPNIGLAPQDRAKNFVAFRYSSIYCKTSGLDPNDTTEPDESQFLAKLETKLSAGAPGRVVVDIIFTYQKTVSGRQSAYYVGVDVTDQFPFIHSALTDYIPS